MQKMRRELKPLGRNHFSYMLSAVYSGILSARNLYFDTFEGASVSLGRPTISVGGISAGGTGKTPLVSTICMLLHESGMVPVILSRGYGRSFHEIEIVRPGETADWRRTGDEPAMLHARHDFIWLAIYPDRKKAAASIIADLPPNAVFVLDDGFQRRDVRRDLDIVCVHPAVLDDAVIPAGTLRERLEGLRRASMICMIGGESESITMEAASIRIQEMVPCVKQFHLFRKTGPFINLNSGRRSENLDTPVSSLSGIARPERFLSALKYHGIVPSESIIMKDHHSFSKEDIDLVMEKKPVSVVTTEKDAVRLCELILVNPEIFWYLNLEVDFNSAANEAAFNESVLNGIGRGIS